MPVKGIHKMIKKKYMLGIIALTFMLTGAGTLPVLAEEQVETEVTESVLDDIFKKEIEPQTTMSMKKIHFVINGFEFTCPPDYNIIYFDEVGPTVYIADSFQMKTVVRPVGYEETLKDKEKMTEKAIGLGAEITREVTETEINGRKIAYYRMDLLGDDTIAMYTASPDPEKSLAGQFVVQNPNLKEEEALKIFAEIMDSAVITDKADSTKEDIDEQVYAPEPIGEMKEESTLEIAGKKVTFKVAENFYSDFASETETCVYESFIRPGDYASADIYLLANEETPKDAATYISEKADGYAENGEGITETIQVDGHDFYCYSIDYEYDGSMMYRVFAVCDLPDGGLYEIEAVQIDGDKDMSLDTIKPFMMLQ